MTAAIGWLVGLVVNTLKWITSSRYKLFAYNPLFAIRIRNAPNYYCSKFIKYTCALTLQPSLSTDWCVSLVYKKRTANELSRARHALLLLVAWQSFYICIISADKFRSMTVLTWYCNAFWAISSISALVRKLNQWRLQWISAVYKVLWKDKDKN